MSNFNYQIELKKIIDSKQLVEIDLGLSDPFDHFIAYILDVSDDYLTFARVSNDLTLQGVSICRMENLESVQAETEFIRELRRDFNDDNLQKEVIKELESINDFSFEGFISAFDGTSTVVDVMCDDASYSGRVIGHDATLLAMDEYYVEDGKRFARSYINPSTIVAITVGGTWLKILSRSLVNKNL